MGEILVDRRKVGINVAGSTRISRSDVPHMMFNGIGYILSRKFAAPIFYLWARHVSGGGSPSASAPAFTGNSTERIASHILRLRLLIVPVLSENGGQQDSADISGRVPEGPRNLNLWMAPHSPLSALPLRLLSFTEWISPGAGGPETGGSDSGRRTHSSNVPQGRKAKTPPTLVGALIAGCARD
ncbi:uncharacterized protein CLUP02_15699 [Colletotrichum lupini]|uniref:Uncharacterized protein n=1 Tax=Colletotrichum lupini TaxID=145971 RepID=A0A9Q8T6J2_9PEZI|nr:uncharacterized protein CLUP02_15699 [Colletotrichum lupini]UQC90169.1 hypothetical protein CLUP02_15699 [Colletotrichum lupini]